MTLRKLLLAPGVLALGCVGSSAQASIMFSFTESAGIVSMQSSGTLNTLNLVSATAPPWGGTGIEANSPPDSDILGDTSMGSLDLGFRFSLETDFSPWRVDMFTQFGPFFGLWNSTGTTQFATYWNRFGRRAPGIGIASEDLVGALWSPDVSWTATGTLDGLGLTKGTYTIVDAQTAESITVRIGSAASAVPAPATLFGVTLGLIGLGLSRARVAHPG